ncbi:MAG: transposase [Desulfuromonadaceae bacterium]|nr:transposase [Desulfuromonadaceae bacterium]
MAQDATGHQASKERSGSTGRVQKKLSEIVDAACVKNHKNLPVRLMFQDKARFGRMSGPRSCWSPAPYGPVVNLVLIREFRYEYAAVSLRDGALDYMTAEKMHTENMSRFLEQVSTTHQGNFIVMAVDGASSHKSKDLKIPENVAFVMLPPYSPELNPAEQIWNSLRKYYFANKVFDSLDAATEQSRARFVRYGSQSRSYNKFNQPAIDQKYQLVCYLE